MNNENNEKNGVACSFNLIAWVLIEQGWKTPVSEKTPKTPKISIFFIRSNKKKKFLMIIDILIQYSNIIILI